MVKKKATKQATQPEIRAWQDDPKGLNAVLRPVPDLKKAPLKFKIKGPTIVAKIYPVGTPEFRYWTAAEALRRGGDFWASLGIKKWQSDVGSILPVGLNEGVDLNAYYDRTELAFFHDTVADKTIYSGESPDVVCHELGHAILDAHRPKLWDANFIEVGAFHESFGDMSAILCALQLPKVRARSLTRLIARKPSALSRSAEQLGWAIRQIDPNAVDPDCLRNAFNKFKYVNPLTLPTSAPASKLSAEVHSFSRVFTGAFYDILSGMLNELSTSPTESHLLTATNDLGLLLLDAIKAAPIKPNYFTQVAARIIDADTVRFAGKYRTVLTEVFVDRQILSKLSVNSAAKVTKAVQSAIAGVASLGMQQTDIVEVELSAKKFGLGSGCLTVDGCVEQAPSLTVAGGQARSVETGQGDVEAAVSQFVDMLVQNDRIQVGIGAKGATTKASNGSLSQHSHRVVKHKQGLKLERLKFYCGCSRS